MGIPYPVVNGKIHSWSSLQVKINGVGFTGFKSLNYERTKKRDMPRGPHPDPIGKTAGENEYKADIELTVQEFAALQLLLGGPGYGNNAIVMTVSYFELGLPTITDTIIGATVDSTNASNSKGSDASYRKIDLSPLKILFNGIDDELIPLTIAAAGG